MLPEHKVVSLGQMDTKEIVKPAPQDKPSDSSSSPGKSTEARKPDIYGRQMSRYRNHLEEKAVIKRFCF